MGRSLKLEVTRSQHNFMKLDVPFPLFVGGVGCGKTYTLCMTAILYAFHSPDAVIAIYEPTFKLVRKVLVPTMTKVCRQFGLKYHYHKTEHRWTIKHPQCGTIIFESMEDPETIVGDEIYIGLLDELDVMKQHKAELAFNKVTARARQWPEGLAKKHMRFNKVTNRYEVFNRVMAFTTPEGYKFCYDRWVTKANDETALVYASTTENWTLAEDYVPKLRAMYPGPLVDAYVNGKFVNLDGGNVYHQYDRHKCNSTEEIQEGEPLYIGCDFNVRKMAATVYVKRNLGKEWHAVAELSGLHDTPALIERIKSEWPNSEINMYPDATGIKTSSQKSRASESDIGLLEDAGFNLISTCTRRRKANPHVADRINAVNAAFYARILFVNYINCPNVASCLEKQGYDKGGDPDKDSGFDHQNDATGYPIAYEFPINRPVEHLEIGWAV